VAELGVPLEAALSACGVDMEAEESVELDVELWSEDGAAWVVWAEGSLAGAVVCWARADPA
jgi:hypothetical protein